VPQWTLFGLHQGSASTRWPAAGADAGQAGVLGMPRLDARRCQAGCSDCADACITRAIRIEPEGAAVRVALDYGRCVACQLCVEVCPSGALQTSPDWALAVRERDDLVWREALASAPARELASGVRRVFGRSLHVRHVDAGSCNGCESELQALNNPFYNLHRLGIFFTPSPRFADLLLVTGTVTYAMREPLLATYDAMPEPRWVMASGTCAVCGGVAEGGYAGGHGLDGVLPVDVWLPGCPPNPAALIHALLLLVERAAPTFSRGRHVD